MFKEAFQTIWNARYGAEPEHDHSHIEAFLKHRSIRQFSPEPIEEILIQELIAAAQSASTSSHLQLWSIISVQNIENRVAIANICGEQKHIEEAPWFFAFLADLHRIRQIATQAGENPEGLDYMEFLIMSVIDASLAAERMVCAAESLGLGVCYIGSLRNNVQAVQEQLLLPQGVFGVFGLCIGWPTHDSSQIKPRLPQDSIWFRETYNSSIETKEFDSRMDRFYDAQKMDSKGSWSQRSGRRVNGKQMAGREALKDWLEKQGFGLR